tara:strand:+ start:3534 stop:4529 length:996 start_codon:yes stop_codon:yes gene_type:complete
MDFMNIASPSYIRAYIDSNFKGCGKYSSNNAEYMMPSVFVEDDWKHKFSINTNTGLWQDFKAHRQGNFIQFVAQVEKISYRRAEAKVVFENIGEPDEPSSPYTPPVQTKLEIDTSSWIPIDIYSCHSSNSFVQLAWKYLWDRKLFNVDFVQDEPFYFASDGEYKNRIIIPFRGVSGDIYFFQARALFNDHPKYLNPVGIKASSVLYPYLNSDEVLVCEGPLDAISLHLAGINATATMGSSPSQFQIEIMKQGGCELIIAYDNDEAGKKGIEKLERLRKQLMLPAIKICPPPPAFKDWNEAWKEDFDIKSYVEENTKNYDIEYLVNSNIESG